MPMITTTVIISTSVKPRFLFMSIFLHGASYATGSAPGKGLPMSGGNDRADGARAASR
jgi:hypothetical protein